MAQFGVSPWATADWGGPPLTLTPSKYKPVTRAPSRGTPSDAKSYRPTKRRSLLDMQLEIRNKIAAEQLKQMRDEAREQKRLDIEARGARQLEPYRQQKRSPGEILRDKIGNEQLKKLREEAANRQAVYTGVGRNALGNLGGYKAGRVAARAMHTGGPTGRASFDPYGGDPGIGATPELRGMREVQGQTIAPYAVEGNPMGPAQPIPPWMQGRIRPQPNFQDTRSILGRREKGGTVPKTGPYELHKGEIVVSADQVDDPLLHALKTDKLQKMNAGQMDGKGTGPGRSLAAGSYRGGTMKGYKKGTLGSYQKGKGFGPASDYIDDYWRQFILDEDLSNLPGARPESGMTVPPRRGMPPADWERFLGGERPPAGGAPRGGAMVPSRGGGVAPGRGGGAMSVLEGGMDLPPSSGDLFRTGAPPGAGGGGDIPNVESMWDKWRVTGTRSPGGKGARSLGPGAQAAGPGVDDALAKVAKRTKIPAKSLRGLGWQGLIAVAGAAGAYAIARSLFGGDGEAEAADVIPGRPPGPPPEEALLGGGPGEMTPEDILALEPGGGAPQGDKFDEWTQQYQAQQEEAQQRKMRDLSLLARGAPRPEAGAAPEGRPGGTGTPEDPFTVPSMSEEEFAQSERKAKYVRDKMETERDKETAVKNNIQADRLDRYLAGNASAMDQAQWQQMTQQVARLRKSAETIDTRMEDRKKIETVLASDADKSIAEYRKAVDVARLEEGGKMAREHQDKMDTHIRDLDDKYDAYSMKFSEGKIENVDVAREKMARLTKERIEAEGGSVTMPIARVLVEWDMGEITEEQKERQIAALQRRR